jgi:hypothetical protein
MLSRKDWLTTFALPLAVGLIISFAGYFSSRDSQSPQVLYYDDAVNNTPYSLKGELRSFGVIRLLNLAPQNLSDVEVHVSNFPVDAKFLEISPESGEWILADPLNAKSVDENGVLRIKYSKVAANSETKIRVVSDSYLYIGKVLSPSQNIELRSITSIPRSNVNQSWFDKYVFMFILNIILLFGIFLSLKKMIERAMRSHG